MDVNPYKLMIEGPTSDWADSILIRKAAEPSVVPIVVPVGTEQDLLST